MYNNRQTGRDNIYHGRLHIEGVLLSKSISEDFAKWRQQRFQRDARDRDNRSSTKILRLIEP